MSNITSAIAIFGVTIIIMCAVKSVFSTCTEKCEPSTTCKITLIGNIINSFLCLFSMILIYLALVRIPVNIPGSEEL